MNDSNREILSTNKATHDTPIATMTMEEIDAELIQLFAEIEFDRLAGEHGWTPIK